MNNTVVKTLNTTKSATILLLSTYPFKTPRHGGQIRVSEIANVYQENGFEVYSIAVYDERIYSVEHSNPNDIPFPKDSPFHSKMAQLGPFFTDFLTGDYASSDDGAFNIIVQRLPKKVDVIEIEQPWLLPVALRLLQEVAACAHACLIFSSQNIEFLLKKSILESLKIPNAENTIEQIKDLERTAVKNAKLSIAVTQADKEILEGLGAKNVLLAPNGISPWQPSKSKIEYWRNRLPQAPFLLYIASAHPPNFTGFIKCVGESLACIPPTSRLVVIGSVCEHLYHELNNSKWRTLNLSRLLFLFELSNDDLSAIKELSHGFLLPIMEGGGSNIKTAEALYSGKYVICTTASLRGYNAFKSLPEVMKADTPKEFQAAIRSVLTCASAKSLTPAAQRLREKLTWNHCLKRIPETVIQALK